jgi:hypothetical protein
MIEYTVQVSADKTKWHLNGQLHRADGPAIEGASGFKSWWLNGLRHRTDGPAVEWASGHKSWWLEGKEVTQADVMKPVKHMTVAEIETLLGHKIKIVAG